MLMPSPCGCQASNQYRLPRRSVSRPKNVSIRADFAKAISQPLNILLAINSADSVLASNQTELLLASAYFQVRRWAQPASAPRSPAPRTCCHHQL